MVKKIFCIFLLITILLIPMTTYAEGLTDKAAEGANKFIQKSNGTEFNIKEFSDGLYNLLLAIGVLAAVIVGSVLGIKFMVSSVEDKANIKNVLIVYVVGCVVIFGAFTIWKIVTNILSSAV